MRFDCKASTANACRRCVLRQAQDALRDGQYGERQPMPVLSPAEGPPCCWPCSDPVVALELAALLAGHGLPDVFVDLRGEDAHLLAGGAHLVALPAADAGAIGVGQRHLVDEAADDVGEEVPGLVDVELDPPCRASP